MEVTAKANSLLGITKRSIQLTWSQMVKLFITLVRPMLEYGNSVWGPAFILHQRKLN